ncbi:MAG: benzoyl-CoA-dihydrodiol lyase [Acidimicrobiaceae bacterium]|nr:benzoyl-CoA-dihydrodiol lyase [Acidimicrobiaceae bacterium]
MPALSPITFERTPDSYRHWRVEVEAPLATVIMAVDPDGALRDGYQLKLNSYDLAVDIELADIVQRLRFEHPGVRAVVVTSAADKVFCAGANIQMLAGSTHHDKVNFCKFTNETRNAIEDASANSGQVWLAAVNGTAAGGGYELALACEEIILVDDRSSSVSLPEVPVLGVLPGTGGLTRLVDKRHVRRDLADLFATRTDGCRGQQAIDWGLVDSLSPPTSFADHVRDRARARAGDPDRSGRPGGIHLLPLARQTEPDALRYPHVEVTIDRPLSSATFTLSAPTGQQPATSDEVVAAGSAHWPLAVARAFDDAMLHLRFNEPEIGTWILRTSGDHQAVLGADEVLRENAGHWLVDEIVLNWKRTFKRLDLSARTIVTLVEPGSCFAGTLAELVLAADRSFMLTGGLEGSGLAPAAVIFTEANDGRYPMANGLTRLASRFWGHDEAIADVRAHFGKELLAAEADELGLVTSTPDDIDWDDDVRLMLEERAAFSPDALTGMEASFRFVGPETIETKIFGRLTAWQNWIFQRPNASGPDGSLARYGSGSRPAYDRRRV